MDDFEGLGRRLETLERQNVLLRRSLSAGLALFSTLLLAAWQFPHGESVETLKVRRLEVVDARGVPMVTLGLTRGNDGGSIVLRDQSGDKRSWWESEAGGARIVFESPGSGPESRTIAGISTAPGKAQLSLMGEKGGAILNSVNSDRPVVTLQDSSGHSLFTAPWKAK